MEAKSSKMAILIDSDNAQSKLLKPILEEVSKYGKIPSEEYMEIGLQIP